MERSQDDNTTQKGDMRDIKNYRPSVYFPTFYNCSHGYYKNE